MGSGNEPQKVIVSVEAKNSPCKRWLWFLAGFGLAALLALSFLLFRSCQGGDAPLPPDTSSAAVIDSAGEVSGPDLPEDHGKSSPAVDTDYQVKYVLYWPEWAIAYLDYRDQALKLIALRKEIDADSVTVRSQTYYAPQAFQVRVEGDSIYVDTFPHTVQYAQPEVKKKALRISALAELDTQDGLGLGVETSLCRLARLQGTVGVSRICHELGVVGFPANQKSPYLRLRLQIALP